MALELAYTVKERWPEYSIFWVPAVSGESFEQAYRDIAAQCSIALNPTEEDPKQSVRRYLNGGSAGKWLLIVDNSDDEEVLFGTLGGSGAVTDFLPESENGLPLFPTRHRAIAVSLAGNEIVEMQEMDHKEAETFLKQSLIQKELLQDQAVATELLKELTHLPLAIAQAAAYVNAMQILLHEYLSLLRNTEQDTISLLSREFRDETRYKNSEHSKNAVAATWLVSFNHIRRSDPVAADLLSFMSCIEHKAIPGSILPLVEPEERMVHAIGTLRAYAFVTRRSDGESYDMHRLVHLATKVWLSEHGAIDKLNKRVAARLTEIFSSDDCSNRAIWREYFPHAFHFIRNTKRLDVEARYNLRMAVGRYLQVDRRVKEAVELLEQVVAMGKEVLAEDHPSRLTSQHALTEAYRATEQIKKAVEQIVIMRKEVFMKDHFSRLASQHFFRLTSQHALIETYRVIE